MFECRSGLVWQLKRNFASSLQRAPTVGGGGSGRQRQNDRREWIFIFSCRFWAYGEWEEEEEEKMGSR